MILCASSLFEEMASSQMVAEEPSETQSNASVSLLLV